jgi:hypothetical protein
MGRGRHRWRMGRGRHVRKGAQMVGTSSCKEGMAPGIAVHFCLGGGWEWWMAPSVGGAPPMV